MNRARTLITALILLGAFATALVLWKYSEWVAIPKARASMIAFLKDPGSAQFRNERITKAGALCGEVNSKNEMGGYVGFKKYVSLGPESNYIEDHGHLGRSSTQEIIEHLQRKTEILKKYNALRKDGLPVPDYSDSELDDRARDLIFNDRWETNCEADAA